MLGRYGKSPVPSEMDTRKIVRKSLTTYRALPAGHRLAADDLIIKRPGNGISPDQLDAIIGRILRIDVDADQTLESSMLVDEFVQSIGSEEPRREMEAS